LHFLILLETPGRFGLRIRIVALGVEGRLPAFWRSECHLDACVLEHVIRRGKLFEPESGFPIRIAELVV